MSVKADGTLLIETGVDLEGFETDCRKLQQSAKRAAKSILDIEKNLESVMRQLASSSSEAVASTDEAEHKAKSAQKEARETAKSAKEAAKEAGKAKKELDGIRDKKITITRMEDTSQDEYDGPLYGPEKADPRFMGYSREAMEAIGIGAEEAETSVNELYLEITKTEDALKQMEAAGQWFGDSDYDDAYTKLKILNQEAKEYQERLNLDSSINPFDQESFAGQIRDAELELARLASAGKGLGSKEFDEVYRKLALLKEEAKAYAKELAKTPDQAAKEENLKKLGESAKISRKKIVELNDEISRLKKRQKELYEECFKNEEAEKAVEGFKEAVRGIRNTRTEMNVPVNRKTSLYIVGRDADTCARYEACKRSFVNLAFSKEIQVQETKDGIGEDAVSVVVSDAVVYLPLEDLVDREKEIERLTKEQERLTKEIARCQGMLNNPNFVNKAPAAKVDAEKEKLQKYEEMMEKVNVQLSQMQK